MTSPGPGDIVAGKYRVERILGEGGMGIVLGAQHVTLGERVALKVLRPEALADAEARARFLREARAAARMKGDHIARVLDVESPDDGTPFIAMEYLEGSDLSHLVETHGVLPLQVAVDYVLQACEALAEAHALGIVHRDVKPSNLFLTRAVDGSPLIKVLDFGISKATSALDATRPDFDMTATQSVLGSPAYMAPEQMRSSKRVDGRTDIWAVGTILHELLTARPPFEAKTMPELCAMILQDPPPRIGERRPDVPAGFEAVVARCLEKAPGDRFATIHDLAEALAPYGGPGAREAAARIGRTGRPAPDLAPSDPRIAIGSTPTVAAARTASTASDVASPRRRFVWAFATAAVFALALVGVALIVFTLRYRAQREAAATAPIAIVASATIAEPSASTAPPSAPAPPPPPTVVSSASAPAHSASAAVHPSAPKPTVRPVSTTRATPVSAPSAAPTTTAPSIASSRYD